MNNDEYVIIGDTEEYSDCLVYVCRTLEKAVTILDRMLNNPTENDKSLIQCHTNLRIVKVLAKDCWWNYGCD